MNYTSFFTEEKIQRTFTIECFQKDEDLFLRTHYPLHFLLHRSGPGERDKRVDEEVLLEDWNLSLNQRRNTGDFIRPYVIWGAPGTGKTELCRLLEIKIRERNPIYKVIRVSKRDLAMGGILGIAQTLTHKQIDIGTALLSESGGQSPASFYAFILGLIENNGQNPDFKIQAKSGSRGDVFLELGNRIVANIQERAEKLTSDDISTLESVLEFLKPADCNDLKIYDKSNSLIGHVNIVQKSVNYALYKRLIPIYAETESVEKLIYHHIEEINHEGKIPVFIFDDVTFVGSLIKDLISVITDISGDKGYVCDFIIGTTTDFYKKYFSGNTFATVQARLTEIKLSPDGRDAKSANWLVGENGLEHFLDFCLKYINAAYAVDKHDIEKHVSKYYFDKNDLYYPFSKLFLINLYNRIVYEQKHPSQDGLTIALTPRYISQVLRTTLLEFFKRESLPSVSIQSCLDLATEDFFTGLIDYNKNSKYYLTVWWYGDQSDGTTVEISKEFIKEVDLEDNIPASERALTSLRYNISSIIGDGIERKVVTEGGFVNITPLDHSEQQLKATIRSWMNNDKSVSFSENTLTAGINIFIKSLKKSLVGSKNSSNYMNRRSSRNIADKVNALSYKVSNKNEAEFSIHLTPNKEIDTPIIYFFKDVQRENVDDLLTTKTLYLYLDVDDYLNLYHLGQETDDGGRGYQNLLYKIGDELKTILDKQNFMRRQLLEENLNSSIEAFILSLYLILGKIRYPQKLLENPINTWKDVYEYFSVSFDNQINQIDEKTFIQNLQNKLPSESEFKTIEGLVLGLFTMKGDSSKRGVMDYPLLSKTLREIKEKDPYSIVMNAKLSGIDNNFVLLPGDKQFKSYLDSVIRSLQYMKNNTWTFDIEKMREIKLYIEKVGDDHKFHDECSAFIQANLSDRRFLDLRNNLNKLNKSAYDDAKSELSIIENLRENKSTYKSELEGKIIETLCSYRLDQLYDGPYITFLKKLENTLDGVKNELQGQELYDLEQLRERMQSFVNLIQEAQDDN